MVPFLMGQALLTKPPVQRRGNLDPFAGELKVWHPWAGHNLVSPRKRIREQRTVGPHRVTTACRTQLSERMRVRDGVQGCAEEERRKKWGDEECDGSGRDPPGLRVTGRALVRHTPGPNSPLETQGHRA